jgi:hypothetical protein
MQQLYHAERIAGSASSEADNIEYSGSADRCSDDDYIDPNWLMNLKPGDLGGDVTEEDLLAVAKYFMAGETKGPSPTSYTGDEVPLRDPLKNSPIPLRAKMESRSPLSIISTSSSASKRGGGGGFDPRISDDLSSGDDDDDDEHDQGNTRKHSKRHSKGPQYHLHSLRVVISGSDSVDDSSTARSRTLSQRSISETAVMPVRSHRWTEEQEEGDRHGHEDEDNYDYGERSGDADSLDELYAGGVDGLLKWTKGLDADDI